MTYFYRKYAPRCSVCREPILPENYGQETVRVVALDRNFHVNCYRCEVGPSPSYLHDRTAVRSSAGVLASVRSGAGALTTCQECCRCPDHCQEWCSYPDNLSGVVQVPWPVSGVVQVP